MEGGREWEGVCAEVKLTELQAVLSMSANSEMVVADGGLLSVAGGNLLLSENSKAFVMRNSAGVVEGGDVVLLVWMHCVLHLKCLEIEIKSMWRAHKVQHIQEQKL